MVVDWCRYYCYRLNCSFGSHCTISIFNIFMLLLLLLCCCFFLLVFSPSLRCDLQFDKILSEQNHHKNIFPKQKEKQFRRRLGFLIFIYVFLYVLSVFRVRLCRSDAIKLNTLRSNSLMLLTDL